MTIVDFPVQQHARTLALRSPAHVRSGPFLVRFTPTWANPLANYAIPDDHAEPGAQDVRALIEVFRAHDRTPRLEFLPTCAPAVEPALLAAGFVVEDRPSLMACPPGDLAAAKPVEGLVLFEPRSDADLFALATVQHHAYAEPGEPDREAVGRLRRTYENGGIVLLARFDGEPAGGGSCSAPVDGLTELCGVAVAERVRRRGVGAAVSARLTELAFERGFRLPWLEPSGPESERVYAGIGYRAIGEKLNISLPGDGPGGHATR
jgi:GNAT superfamily N-acetyltransferase